MSSLAVTHFILQKMWNRNSVTQASEEAFSETLPSKKLVRLPRSFTLQFEVQLSGVRRSGLKEGLLWLGKGNHPLFAIHSITTQEHMPKEMKTKGQVPEDTLSLVTQLGGFGKRWAQQPHITGLLAWRPAGMDNHLTSQASKEDPVPQPLIHPRGSTAP